MAITYIRIAFYMLVALGIVTGGMIALMKWYVFPKLEKEIKRKK